MGPSIIPILRRLKQEDLKFVAGLSYTVRPCIKKNLDRQIDRLDRYNKTPRKGKLPNVAESFHNRKRECVFRLDDCGIH